MDKLSAPLDEFKERELEIINLMADGLSNQEIADTLFITKETVRWYNKQIYSKLGTSRRTEAIALARDMGLIGANADEQESVRRALPLTIGPFIGRDAEINELTGLLAHPETRLISIIATGGMGKSRLSLELAHLVQANYEHGAVFVDLAPIRNPDEIVTVTLNSLGISASETPQQALFDYCREKELLLIFDNFEHVLAGASLLTDILQNAPQVSMIASSREQLNLRSETVFYLHPIIEDGIDLFIEVAAMMRPDIVISDNDIPAVKQIVELVGGSPLALMLAATWVDTLSIVEIATEIETGLDFLSSDLGDMPERQRSIHAVIDPTWKRLNEREQRAFMLASVFRGGFTRDLFQQVTGASVRVIQTLLKRSLITRGYGQRFDLHPLLRQYAREKLEQNQLLATAKNAHLAALLAYAETHYDRMYDGQHYLDALAAFDCEQDNFRAALDWSFSGHDIENGLELIIILNTFWNNRSQLREAIYYVEAALAYHPKVARLYMFTSFYYYRLGQLDIAKERINKAITLAQEAQTLDILANSYRISAILYDNEKSIEETQKLFEEALQYAEESGVSYTIAACHDSLGNTYSSTQLSLEHCQKALSIWEERGDLQGISRTIYNMSVAHYRQGDVDRARELCERSLTLKHQIGDRAGVARRLSVLANWDILEEEFERAERYLAEARTINEELGEQARLYYTSMVQGVLHLIMGEYGQSEIELHQALQIATTLNDVSKIEICHGTLALLYMLQEKVAESWTHVQQSIEAMRGVDHVPWTSMIAYANYLWYQRDIAACTPIVAVLHFKLEQLEYGKDINNQYFLRPLIYRVQQAIGADAWQDALAVAAETTIEQIFDGVVQKLEL